MPEFSQPEWVQAQFTRLIEELLSGNLHRAKFRPWEIEILLDIESCHLAGLSRRRILKEYQDAVLRYFAGGGELPFKLSAYLESLPTQNKPARRESAGRKPGKPPVGEPSPLKSASDRSPRNR